MIETKRDFIDSDRGFTCYLEMEDTYGARVRVKDSSADPLDKVWIFIEGGELKKDTGNKASAHLNVDQALEVHGALVRWLGTQGIFA